MSIDGATQSTYQKYRVGGRLENMLNNIRKLNEYKRMFNSEHSHLIWKFILFAHNEHEVSLAQEMGGELGMGFQLTENADPEYVSSGHTPSYETHYEPLPQLPAYGTHFCLQMFTAPMISWDGRLFGCCINSTENDYGNVFKSGLKACISSKRYQYALKMLRGEKQSRADIPCTGCFIYRVMRESGKYIAQLNVLTLMKKAIKPVLI